MSESSAADGAPAASHASDERAIRIAPGFAVPRAELVVRVSRASGAGGQHVNKTSTRVELVWNLAQSRSVPDDARARLMERLASRIAADGTLRVVASDTRSQMANRELAEERFAALVRAALAVPKARKPTKPTRASRERRLDSKKRNSQRKRNRRGFDE